MWTLSRLQEVHCGAGAEQCEQDGASAIAENNWSRVAYARTDPESISIEGRGRNPSSELNSATAGTDVKRLHA
jgi:hypothetical protein